MLDYTSNKEKAIQYNRTLKCLILEKLTSGLK